MKIVLDIDQLREEGQISPEEYERLKAFALKETGSLAFNILVGFGVMATAVGALALVPSPWTALFLGAILAVAGTVLRLNLVREWGLLGGILLLIGAVTLAGGIIALTEGDVTGFLIVTVLCAIAAVISKSVLLAMIATLSLSAVVGAATAYEHASYFLVIRQPTLTIGLFSVLALATYHLSKRLSADYERIALAVSRTSLFLINLGFWIGSLWGDSLWMLENSWNFRSGALIPDWVFVIGWAVGLLATGAWAARANRRWVVNLLAVFGAIHFYTQFFERLGPSPGAILMAGMIAIAIAFALVAYNKSRTSTAEDAIPS